MGLMAWIRDRLSRPDLEPEYEEDVEHDTVMVKGPDGRLTEVTADDPEIRE